MQHLRIAGCTELPQDVFQALCRVMRDVVASHAWRLCRWHQGIIRVLRVRYGCMPSYGSCSTCKSVAVHMWEGGGGGHREGMTARHDAVTRSCLRL